MAVTTPTTELEAVNQMLEAIGTPPVSSLSVAGRVDVSKAQEILDRTTRDIQSWGWDFNTDEDFPLTRDGNGYIQVPADAMRIDAHDRTLKVVDRGGYLWDKTNHTFVFDSTLKCDIIRAYPFDELPQAARRYITAVAGRQFVKAMLGEELKDRFSAEDEAWAKHLMEDAHADTDDTSMANDPTIAWMIAGHRRPYGS